MSPPLNSSLAELIQTFGEENVRTLVRTFLREFPISIQALRCGDRKDRRRIAHSMKGNSRLMGGHELAARMAAIEERLAEDDTYEVVPHDHEMIAAEFETLAAPLRAFVGSGAPPPADQLSTKPA